MDMDASGWSGEGDFTQRLIDVLSGMPEVAFLRIEDAPASRADAGFSFISNEVFVGFGTVRQVARSWILGLIPLRRTRDVGLLTLAGLESSLSVHPAIGPPDYADEGMLQYLRTERIIPPYQTRGYKLVELVRVYEAGSIPRRDD